ncbi:MAG: histidine kinase [Holophagaceae bacterium]|nr:histidine kinase [Holophagaceae bacterium]
MFVFASPLTLGYISKQLSLGHPFPWLYLLSTLLVSATFTFLSAVPWEWTGDERPLAPFGRGLIQATLAALGLQVIIEVLYRWLGSGEWAFSAASLIFDAAVAIIFVMTGWIVATYEHMRRERGSARQAQWALLKSQLAPHLFFNSLNSLSELVRRDPAMAEARLLDLAKLFELLLEHGERSEAPLRDEAELLGHYLAIEQLRFGDRLKVEWNWAEAANEVPAPSLLLQPLVENALKHGIGPSEEGGIVRIEASVAGRHVRVRVLNTGAALGAQAPNRRTGTGLRNLRARLHLAYGSTDRLTLTREDPWTIAEMRLELKPSHRLESPSASPW